MSSHTSHHLDGFPYVGLQRYALTFCTYQRRAHFTHEGTVALVLMQIRRAARANEFALVAYCFMPDHLHLLVEALSDAADGRRFFREAKQLSAFHFSRAFGERLWQRYCYEHVLRDDQSTLSEARYIVANPVRAGLARAPGEYPFLGSDVYPIEHLIQGVSEESAS